MAGYSPPAEHRARLGRQDLARDRYPHRGVCPVHAARFPAGHEAGQENQESAPLGEDQESQQEEKLTPSHMDVADKIEEDAAEESEIDKIVDDILSDDEDGTDDGDESEKDSKESIPNADTLYRKQGSDRK